MRRIGLLTLAASAALAIAAPASAPAIHPCFGQPSVENCKQLLNEQAPGTGTFVGTVLYYAENPDEIIVCVRECGPPEVVDTSQPNQTVESVIRIVKHPYDCVQDCDGPPPS